MSLPLYCRLDSAPVDPLGRYILLTNLISQATSTRTLYARVLLETQAKELKDRLFTYRVPQELVAETFVGAQVLVPFGHTNDSTGLVVSLTEDSPAGFKVKDIAEVVEPDPLFDRKYVDFLKWVADYYLANLQDVIQASIPSAVSPKTKRMVTLSDPEMDTNHLSDEARCLVDLLKQAKQSALSYLTLKQRFRKFYKESGARFYRAVSLLRQDGVLTLTANHTKAQSPKTATYAVYSGLVPASARQKAIVAQLEEQGGEMPLAKLIEEASTSYGTIKKLAAQGVVTLVERQILRDPMSRQKAYAQDIVQLTDGQRKALDVLMPSLQKMLKQQAKEESDESEEKAYSKDSEPWLLYGVTGSGKTEVYLRLIEETLKLDKSALLLVPEISLTPQLAGRLKSRFGDLVAVWHSGLSDGERFDTWRRLRDKQARVLLGARSAVLTNIADLGLIILDEEHDGSYKQSTPSPRYHAREVARERAKREGAMLILGSATPDLCTYHRAREEGRILSLPNRVFNQAMPKVTIVDMREEFGNSNRSIFSRLLDSELEACLERKEQAILLLNRRGYASHVFCRACGFVVKCRNCSVSMVFHQNSKGTHLKCHHCGLSSNNVTICPSCKGPFIKQFGLGTQKVEEDVRERFPEAKVVRLDSDVTQRRGAYEEILGQFVDRQADILIGTQMVAKGLDIAGVTLVGVLAGDAAFNLPDYRSMERGFQLLSQVAGRAGRGALPGKVILQTYATELDALRWASEHAFDQFVDSELKVRKEFLYPPFSQIIRLVIQGVDETQVESAAHLLAEQLSRHVEDDLSESALVIAGPAPCLIERLRGKYRYHLIVKNLAGASGKVILDNFLKSIKLSGKLSQSLQVAVDVDALDLL